MASTQLIHRPAVARSHVAGIAAAAGLTLYLTSPAITSPLTPLAVVLLWLSAWISGPRSPRPGALAGLAVISGSALATVPFSWHYGSLPVQTVWLAMLTLALLPLAWHRRPASIWPWLVPPALAHAALAVWQGAVEGMSRAPGLAQNQNAAAAFLALASIYLCTTRYKWLSVPMLVAVAYTGSRWVTLCLAVILAVMFVSRSVHWRYLLVGMAASLALVASAQPAHLAAAYRIIPGPNPEGTIAQTAARNVQDSHKRLRTELPSLVPRGFTDPGTPHNVPVRMMVETGLLSGLAWLALTGWALWRRPRQEAAWWMLLAVALFSLMGYYTWIGPLGGFWWLLVGERLQATFSPQPPRQSGD